MAELDIEATFESKEVRDFLSSMVKNFKSVAERKGRYPGLLSAIIYSDIIEHFKLEMGPNGGWVAWSEIYLSHLQKIGRTGNKKLQFSGRLRNTFTPAKYKPSTQGFLWFNDAMTKGFPYAAAHDTGEGKLPARPFMWLSDKALENVSLQTLQFLTDEGA